jgi:uncharacterized membrane protein
MCLLVVEIIMLIAGIAVLIVGRIKVSENFTLEGWRARVAGVFLIAPLPLAFLAGVLIGVLMGFGALPATALEYTGLLELLLVVGSVVGLVIYSLIVKPKDEAVSIERIESFDE